MKIVNDLFPEGDGNIGIYSCKIEYNQQLDSCQSENDHPDCCQRLICEIDDAGGGKFLRFYTGEAGWSLDFDHLNELIEIFKDFEKRCNP